MIWFVIILVASLCFMCGVIVANCKDYIYKKRQLNNKLAEVDRDSELEIERINFDMERNRDEFKNSLGGQIVASCSTIAFLIFALISYRETCMYDVTVGNYEIEKVVHTKTRGGKVQVDTTYNFYKKEKE